MKEGSTLNGDLISSEGFALMVEGNFMWPLFKERMVIVVNTQLPVINGEVIVAQF